MSRCLSLCAVVAVLTWVRVLPAVEWKSGIEWPEPPVVEAPEGAQPPSDAIVLFDGKDLSQWQGGEKWEVKDGVATAKGGEIVTKQHFGPMQLHLEWASPDVVKGEGQARGNSGVFLMGKYEVQVLDSHDNKTYFDGQAAAIYKQSPPLVNATRKPGEWQTYDIIFHPAKWAADGQVEHPATVTVLHNGVLVQDHFEILGNTNYDQPPKYDKTPEQGPIGLQFHGNPVRYRNIWVRELKPLEGKRTSEPYIVTPENKKTAHKDDAKKDDKKGVDPKADKKNEKSDAGKKEGAKPDAAKKNDAKKAGNQADAATPPSDKP